MADADDFLARAQALGLRLTRADYERTRAGVTAFLKAERVPAASPGPSVCSTDTPDDEPRPPVVERCASPAESDIASGSKNAANAAATPTLSRWLRTTSGQLSFFTAVVRPMSAPNEEGRTRISLDEVGSAEEKRRRRARRRRVLEKQMMLESKLARENSPHAESMSTAEPHSPARTIRASSVASDTMPLEPLTPHNEGNDIVRSSTPVSIRAPSDAPASPTSPASPEINVLNRMARMDNAGKLWLAPREGDVDPKSEDSAAVADDSGVFVEQEAPGWGPRPYRRTSSNTENLNACMKSMSLLDRIMMSKTSPRRMRREAKARARDVTDDEHAETSHDADTSSTSHFADVSSEAPERRGGHVRQRSMNVRWTQEVTTPLRGNACVTEQYDFVIQDISPEHAEGRTDSPTRATGRERATPSASATPLTKLDLGAQITPMRYSPGYNLGYSHYRSASITSMFSPNMLTPWSHQGRLMSNAGLANIGSSPSASGDWTANTSAMGPASASRSHMMYTSTPLSHLPFEDSCLSHAGPSPGRLLCIDSFPGKSPQQRTALSNESPTKPLRTHITSPLTQRSAARTRPALRHESPSKLSASVAGRLDLVHRMAPVYDAPMQAWDKTPFRRTDTVSPADLFHPQTAGPAPWLVPESCGSDEEPVMSPASPASEEAEGRSRSMRARLPRRKSAMLRSSSALAAMTPTHGDDVFAGDAEPDAAAPAIHSVFSEPLPSHDANQTEWDKPDGSRVVKLISEELQAAIDSGTLEHEPEPRYFRLPPGHGSSKAKPSSVSYAGLIGQAILSSSDARLSLAEIYLWISSVYPYYERGDRGWQNSIRHNLSLNKSFVKLERESSIPGKGGWWAIVPGHEARFQNGVYQPNVARTETSQRTFKPSHSAPAGVLRSPSRDERGRKKRQGALEESPVSAADESMDVSFKRPKTTRASRTLRADMSGTPLRAAPAQHPSSSVGQAPMPVLTDSASSPATSPLQSFAQDTSQGTQRAWRDVPGYQYAPTLERSSPPKPSGLAPRAPQAPLVRSLHDIADYNMHMYLASGGDARAYGPPSVSPSPASPPRRAPLRPAPITQPTVPGLGPYNTAYMPGYAPPPESFYVSWPEAGHSDLKGPEMPMAYANASPSRLAWARGP